MFVSRPTLNKVAPRERSPHPLRTTGKLDSMASRLVPSRGGLMGHVLRSSSGVGVLPGTPLAARQRQFCTTKKRASKLGRTPITIPPGVELSISDVKTKRIKTSYKPAMKKTIQVKGPLGELNLDVPEFVTLQQDLENKTALLSVEDANVKNQQTMW
ncbi:hypothetical protein E4U42_000048, partial [Claviceps africana]